MTKYIKKISSLCLALILCFPAIVGAAGYQAKAMIPVTVKVNEINGMVPDEGYTLTIERKDGSRELLPDNTTLKVGKDSSAEFGPITYTAPGDYYYLVKQVAGSDEYTTYDEGVYTVGVHVRNVLDKDKLTTEAMVATITAGLNDGTEKPANIEFINGYDKPVVVEKEAPKTGDGVDLTLHVTVIALSTLVLVFVSRKRSAEDVI